MCCLMFCDTLSRLLTSQSTVSDNSSRFMPAIVVGVVQTRLPHGQVKALPCPAHVRREKRHRAITISPPFCH